MWHSETFDEYATDGKCDVCGKQTKVGIAASIFSGSFAYCEECLHNRLEPYHAMVDYIACAGHFPDDINIAYQIMCRHILKGLGVSEERFIKDVDDRIESIWRTES